jgi:hypothetical protein
MEQLILQLMQLSVTSAKTTVLPPIQLRQLARPPVTRYVNAMNTDFGDIAWTRQL